ncbi:MAG: hypothetical protein ACREDS_10935, partial [Limisphaerales bacterium]
MPKTLTSKERKHRGPRIHGIFSDADALGVTPKHLALVLRGKRKSEPLQARYKALKESQLKQRMDKSRIAESQEPADRTKSPGAAQWIPFPIEFAALQNLRPAFLE